MGLSRSERKAIKKAKDAYNKAKKNGNKRGMEKAHADAERIRSKHNYSGGVDGSQHIPTGSGSKSGGGKKHSGGSSHSSGGSHHSSGSSSHSSYGYDPNGNKIKVDIRNGVSYISGTNKRPSTGSTIQTAGGIYRMGSNGKGTKVRSHNSKPSSSRSGNFNNGSSGSGGSSFSGSFNKSSNAGKQPSSSEKLVFDTGALYQKGSRGNGVKNLQQKLLNDGYNVGSVDGIFGAQTERAVRDYQKDHGLATDGKAGKNTLGSFNSGSKSVLQQAIDSYAQDQEDEKKNNLNYRDTQNYSDTQKETNSSKSKGRDVKVLSSGGEFREAYITPDGKTYYKDNDERIEKGATVQAANGKYYQLTENGGKEDDGRLFKKKERGGQDAEIKMLDGSIKDGYVSANGETFLDSGERIPVGAIVKAPNGKYYRLTENGGVEEDESAWEPGQPDWVEPKPDLSTQESTEEYLQEMLQNQMNPEDVYNLIMSMMPKSEQQNVLSYDEALARASNQYNSVYDKNLENAMETIDKNALKRGFFGQLPTETLKRSVAGDIEAQKAAAINNLANQLVGQSEQSANERAQLDMQQQGNQMNTLLSALQGYANANNTNLNNVFDLIGYYQNERGYKDSRDDVKFNQSMQLKELGLKEAEIANIRRQAEAQIADRRRRTSHDIAMDDKAFERQTKQDASNAIQKAYDIARDIAEKDETITSEEFQEILQDVIKSSYGDYEDELSELGYE